MTKSGLSIEPEKMEKKLRYFLDTGDFKKVVLVLWHGLGDRVMAEAPLRKLRSLYPDIHFDIAVCKGLDQDKLYSGAIEVEGNWRETLPALYDLVVQVNMPVERLDNLSLTKAEVCCIEELGIEPVSGHPFIASKQLVGLSFHCTSVGWLANADENVAKQVWQDVIDTDYVPFECTMRHPFFNPENKLYPFVDKHVRDWPATIDTLSALIGSCGAFISAVGGPFHLALAILGPKRVMLLEKDLKAAHFTKEKIATANLHDYKHEVLEFLGGLR